VSSVYYSLSQPFPGNGFYQRRFFSFPHSGPLVTAAHAELSSTDNSTNWVPGWQPFHTNLLVFSSQADFELTTDNWTVSPTSYFMSLHSTELPTTLTNNWIIRVRVTLQMAIYRQSVHLGASPLMNTLWQEDGSSFYNCCWPLPAQSFSGPSPARLMSTFYCLQFETPQPRGPGPRIYIPMNRVAQL
jgi:hypothetical protein